MITQGRMPPQTSEELKILTKSSKKKGFELWMNDPMVRVMISLIPPGQNEEALKTLLMSTFDAGHDCGQSMVLLNLIEHMFRKKEV